jgi:hypothetical protein
VKEGTVLYVKEDAEWHPEAAKEIPAGDVLIVVDDAHRFEFLDKLLVLSRSLTQRQKVKVLLGTRPSGLGQIDAMLSVRFGSAEVSRFPQLERMPQQGVRELALEVLGAEHAQHAAAAVSADTPLVTVVGGRLIARGDLSPALLANEEDFRHEVFNKFSAEYEQLLPAGAVDWRTLLNLVAAVSPVSPSANQFVDAAAEILRIRPDEVRSAPARFATQRDQAFWLRGIFWSIGSIDATTLGVIDELMHRGDKDSARDALQLIGGAPPQLSLTRPYFVVHIVEEAGRLDLQLGSSAESVFISNALSGPFNRASGQSSPKFLSMKDRCETLREFFQIGSAGRRLFDRLYAAAVETLNRERLDDEEMQFR